MILSMSCTPTFEECGREGEQWGGERGGVGVVSGKIC